MPATPNRVIRDSFSFPEDEYLRLKELKLRLGMLGLDAKKSEILRLGLSVLVQLSDDELSAAMLLLPKVKTGRPVK